MRGERRGNYLWSKPEPPPARTAPRPQEFSHLYSHPRPWRSSAASCFREVASGLVVQQKRSVAIEQHAHARSMIYLCTACALRRLCPALWESVPMRFASSMRFASWPSTADQRKELAPGRNLGGQKRASERRGCRWLTFATPSV